MFVLILQKNVMNEGAGILISAASKRQRDNAFLLTGVRLISFASMLVELHVCKQ